MRTCKKLVALVMALAMLATMFAFSASAADVATLSVTTDGIIAAGDNGTVKVVLDNGTGAEAVGGIYGVVTVTGATLADITVNPAVLEANNDATEETIIKEGENSFKFAAVGDASEWFSLSLTDVEAGAYVTLSAVEFSNTTGSAKLANAVAVEKNTIDVKTAADINVAAVGIKETTDAKAQGFKYEVGFASDIKASDVKEYGILACPNSLLTGGTADLVVGSANTNVKSASIAKADFEDLFAGFIDEGKFNAYVNTGYDTDEDSLRFTGVKIAVRAYYLLNDGTYVYSNNTSDSGLISGGIVNKSILNIALALAADATDETISQIVANPGNYLSDYNNRQKLLDYLFAE